VNNERKEEDREGGREGDIIYVYLNDVYYFPSFLSSHILMQLHNIHVAPVTTIIM